MSAIEIENDRIEIKEVFAGILEEMMNQDETVVYLDADLMNSFGTGGLKKKFPGRALDMGVQEANMVGVAAGLSAVGKKPYLHTFGPFASRRVYDQVFLSGGYAGNSMVIVGSDPGVTAAYNGGTHMPFEDVALYRAIPGSIIFDITDTAQFSAVVKEVKDKDGVIYIRTPRKGTNKVYDKGESFKIGEAKVLKEGKDAVIIASGIMVSEALQAAAVLDVKGVSAAVIDPVTIKPLDTECILKWAKKTAAVVTAENCNVNGGLGDAVASLLTENAPTPMERVAVNDEFGEVGTVDYLQERFGLTASEIEKKVLKAVERK